MLGTRVLGLQSSNIGITENTMETTVYGLGERLAALEVSMLPHEFAPATWRWPSSVDTQQERVQQELNIQGVVNMLSA